MSLSRRSNRQTATTVAVSSVALWLLFLIGSMAAEHTVHQLPSPLSTIGAKTVWDVDSQSLYYVDINVAAIRRYDYAENKTYSCTIDGVNPIAPVILVQGNPNHYVVGSGNKLLLVNWDGRSEKGTLVKTVYDLGESEKHTRFNEGKVDPKGRLYAAQVTHATKIKINIGVKKL